MKLAIQLPLEKKKRKVFVIIRFNLNGKFCSSCDRSKCKFSYKLLPFFTTETIQKVTLFTFMSKKKY